jgi:regulatory protein
VRVLTSRAHSEAQIMDRLARSGLGEQAQEVLGWLRRLGYVDDLAYAQEQARVLLAPGRFGPALAERRLQSAGIEPAMARAAVSAAAERAAAIAKEVAPPGGAPEPAELTLCRAALASKLGGATLSALDERARARLARFLLGRGYSAGVTACVTGFREG